MLQTDKTVYVKTLGCKVNTFDSHAIENQFRAQGFALADDYKAAAITIINTCSVTANAEKEARYLARRIKRENPATKLVFTGCYAQTNSAALVEMKEIDFVVPNETKHDLVQFVTTSLDSLQTTKTPNVVRLVTNNKQSHFKSSVTLFDAATSTQTRAFVKIQDGCNGFCSYCLIPYARGASRSVPKTQVLEEIKRLVDSGVPEIVLTGIHIGDYGEDFSVAEGNNQFVNIIEDIFAIPGLKRLRISSLEPAELSEDLLKALKNFDALFCDHLHLPLQSGSDTILKMMRRKYDTATYRDMVQLTRQYFPGINIGADVIPGFPGETDEHFEETKLFIQQCELSYLHVFPYSKRPNTLAERLPNHIDQKIVKERASKLRELSQQLQYGYGKAFIGQKLRVLWENEFDLQDRVQGHSRNYLTVVSATPDAKPGMESEVLIKGFTYENKLLGVPT